MNNREWAELRITQLDRTKLDEWIEMADLEGALTRMKRTTQHGGAWSSAYRRLHDWRNFHDDTLAGRKANPRLIEMYKSLA